MSAGAQTGVALGATVRRDPVALLALVGSGVLVVEALRLRCSSASATRPPHRCGRRCSSLGALLAGGAAVLARSAARSAAVLCLLAAALGAAAQLPFFVERLRDYYALSFSTPGGLDSRPCVHAPSGLDRRGRAPALRYGARAAPGDALEKGIRGVSLGSNKRIELARRSAGGLTGGRRARSLSAVR